MRRNNLFAAAPDCSTQELFQELVRGSSFRLERIVSTGQATPEGQWYDQPQDEWVVLISGAASLRIAGEADDRELTPGDYIHLPAHCRHRVEWTSADQTTIWLALHFQPLKDACE